MSTSFPRALLALALLAASLPARAGVDLGGDLGVSYTRNDQWGVQGNPYGPTLYTGSQDWWFTGSVRFAASFLSPGVLDIGGSASYLGYRAVGGSSSDGLNYQLRLSALQRTPVNISASASRNTVEFTSPGNTSRTGTTRSDAVGGILALDFFGYPYLSVSLRNTNTSNRTEGQPEVKSDSTNLSARASQSVESLNYTLSYDTDWSSGDFAETNYRNHTAGLQALAQLAPNVTAQVSAAYNLREPTTVDPLNPRIDNQSLATWMQFGSTEEFNGGAGYGYSDSLFEAPGSPVRQFISHSLTTYFSQRFARDFVGSLNLGASLGESVVGSAVQRATGEGIGAGLGWTRQIAEYALQASVSGSVGLIQPSGGPRSGSWGLGATANASRPIGSWTGAAGLAASHDENTGASPGTRDRLFASLGASGSPLGWDFSSLLTGGYSRSRSPSFGDTTQANFRLDANANRAGYSVVLHAGLTDDLAEVLVPGAPPASILVPVDFNTQTRFLTASGTAPALSNLSLSGVFRYLWVSAPGRGDAWESAVSVSATYRYGAFGFSLFEQISVTGADSIRNGTQNLLFLSVSRSFGR